MVRPYLLVGRAAGDDAAPEGLQHTGQRLEGHAKRLQVQAQRPGHAEYNLSDLAIHDVVLPLGLHRFPPFRPLGLRQEMVPGSFRLLFLDRLGFARAVPSYLTHP